MSYGAFSTVVKPPGLGYVRCDVTGTQGSGIPAGIGADSGKLRLWTGIPGIRDCRRVFRSGGTPGVHTGYSKIGTGMHRDFDPWEFFENVEVNAKKKKRSRCSLCGEQWWGIGVHLIAHWLRPRTGGPEEVWQMYEDQRPGQFRLAGEVRGVPREHDAREGREEGRQVRSRSSRVRTRHSDRAAWTWSLLVRRD